MWDLKNKINEQTKQKQISRYREHFDGFGEMGDKGEGLRSALASYENSHRDVKCSTGNAVSNLVITVCAVRWALDFSGWSLCEFYTCPLTMSYT